MQIRSDLVELIVPFGAESAPISFDRFSYVPFRPDTRDDNSGWHVRVPREAVDPFRLTGGFSLYQPEMRRRLSGATLDLEHEEGPASCSFDGDEYATREEVDAAGRPRHVLTLPIEAVATFLDSHPGFKGYAPAPARPASKLLVKAKADGRTIGQKPFAPDPEGTPHPEVQRA